MRAVTFDRPGGPEVLRLSVVPRPQARPGEILIEVHAAGVNRPDVAQRLGRYPVPADADPILGLEVAGVVAALGEGVTGFMLGDRVMSLVHGGGYAEFCRADVRLAMPIPQGWSYAEAAAFPEAAMTVEFNMVMRAGLAPDETVLIHGGSSGVGSHAVLRAVSLGARSITTSRGAAKAAYCRAIGADCAIDSSAQDWVEAVMAETNGRGVDVVLDMVGGDQTRCNVACLADDGRYALISLQSGREASLDLEPVLRRRLTLTGSTLRPLPAERKAAIVRPIAADLLPKLADGHMTPRIHADFALDDAADAHRLLEGGAHFGKVVLIVGVP